MALCLFFPSSQHNIKDDWSSKYKIPNSKRVPKSKDQDWIIGSNYPRLGFPHIKFNQYHLTENKTGVILNLFILVFLFIVFNALAVLPGWQFI